MKKINKRQLRQEQMYALVSKFQNTDQTHHEFCELQQIKPATFYYWQRKIKAQNKESPHFLKLEVLPSKDPKPEIVVIRFANGTVVEIPV